MATTVYGHIKEADPLSEYTATITYENGTVATKSQEVYDTVSTSIEYDAAGHPTKTEFVHYLYSAQQTVLTDLLGHPTATVDYFPVQLNTTLYNSNSVPTATIVRTIAETKSLSTMYDSAGRPTGVTAILQPIPSATPPTAIPTPTSTAGANEHPVLALQRLPDGVYFVGLMLPTLLAILVTIPIRVLNRNVKLYQGFHAMASSSGVSVTKSLTLQTTGPMSLVNGILSLRNGNYLPSLASTLVILGALTIPFSAEVFRLILEGPQCHPGETSKVQCSVGLGVFPEPAQILAALVIILIVGIAVVGILLRKWKTGVQRNPWSLSYMARLTDDTKIKKILRWLRKEVDRNKKIDTNDISERLRRKDFVLGTWWENHVQKYSVLVENRSVRFVDAKEDHQRRRPRWLRGTSANFTPLFMLSWAGRLSFMILLSGIVVAVLTYDMVARGSEYQRGLTGKAVGIRFLFSGAGVIITFAWGSFFDAVAFMSPYKLLKGELRRRKVEEIMKINPPTNSFTGLWYAFVPSRRDLYLGAVAAAGILSEVLPLLLGNIPCNGVQIQTAETVCVYLSVAVLSIMILTMGGSFFTDWRLTRGIDPSTIAGAMFTGYVVDEEIKRSYKKEDSGIV
ncbi:hypothetical protein F4777DRAFT_400217 [Nemania sp. FL0916]|nr:hypothetical protein F4777DRAFT_400217 [Nemania sp. FL0916]